MNIERNVEASSAPSLRTWLPSGNGNGQFDSVNNNHTQDHRKRNSEEARKENLQKCQPDCKLKSVTWR